MLLRTVVPGSPDPRIAEQLSARRRANATAMVLRGLDLKTAQTRLGHSDPRLTIGIYAQATNEADRAAADRLGEHFTVRKPEPRAMDGHRRNPGRARGAPEVLLTSRNGGRDAGI